MLPIRSRSTALPLFSTGSRYWPSPSPSSICSSFGGASSPAARTCGRLALDEALADQRLRAHDAARVAAEVLVAGVGDVEHHGGLLVLRQVDRVDRADADAGDLDVLAGDHEAGVVEDRADLVVLAFLAAPEDEDHHGGGRGDQQDDGGDAGHGPGSTRLGSQSRPPPSVNGADPSAGRCDGGARAAADDAGLDAVHPVGGGHGREQAAGRVVGELERVEDRLDAREVAVGVVVGGALAEAADPADEVRRVGPRELEHRLGAHERLASVAEGGRGGALERRHLARGLDEVVVGAGPADRGAQVADRRACRGHQRAQLAQERRQVLGGGLGLRDQHVEVVERRAQVHEGGVGAPQRGRQQPERLGQRGVLGADRGRRLVGVADELGEVVAALGDRGRRAARVDQELGQRRLVLGQLLDEPARARQDGVEVLRRQAASSPSPAYWVAKPDDVGQVAVRLLVERVEDLVEVDDVGGVLGAERGAVGQLLGVAGRGGQGDVAVGDAAQRGEPDDGLRALLSGAYGSSTTTLIAAWLSSVSSISRIEPTRRPPTCTSSSTMSWRRSGTSACTRSLGPRNRSSQTAGRRPARARRPRRSVPVSPMMLRHPLKTLPGTRRRDRLSVRTGVEVEPGRIYSMPSGPARRRRGTGARTGCRS